jgi:hypothetical protein
MHLVCWFVATGVPCIVATVAAATTTAMMIVEIVLVGIDMKP